MGTLLLSAILVSGYIFTVTSVSSRYKFKRSDGWGAYFYVATWGTGFCILSWLICSLMGFLGLIDFFAQLVGINKDNVKTLIPLSADAVATGKSLKIAMWVVGTVVLATGCGLLNKFWHACGDHRFKALAKAARNNPLETLAIEASATLSPVIFTLKSKKFYVGWVIRPPLEHGKIEHMAFIPLLSGYRDKDTLKIVVTTNYDAHYESIGLFGDVVGIDGPPRVKSDLSFNDFRVICPVSEIENLSFFDFETYNHFKAQEEKEEKSLRRIRTKATRQ
ncbi:TPA: hypothetical protein PIP05_004530 [Klebsiella oxytoca]|jgi:hypothetical protein|uniref:hypothetical protein n=1 Tax=Klebsiella oxytoca TaxID=571 RepID=UPI0018C67837|nr:hypothetical protein [Klebsiella oxytoca]MBG2654309.1 hypothetical protein [Klebsiella oxytoca]HBU6577873.1 hypothetical protein [Klebsiella oxytoca]HDH0764880.1 hypothetical protein [Klebsiella oxytoca]HEC2091915.1 hypothetical protein [Klebsiella oxytoca]